jgi:DNA-binding response OmpR family regulator
MQTIQQNPTALIIETDRPVRDTMRLALERIGLVVECAQSVQEALESFRRFRPRLILLNPSLPDGDGLELIPRFRRLAASYIPAVMVVSALGFEEIVRRASEAGAHGFMIKPFSSDELLAHVQSTLIGSLGDDLRPADPHLRNL